MAAAAGGGAADAAGNNMTQLLLHASDADPSLRQAAERQLAAFQDGDYPGFLSALARELADESKPADARRLAGLVLKNALDAKDDLRRAELHARWSGVDALAGGGGGGGPVKSRIRDSLLATLRASLPDVRHTAAMAVAKVAAIDLPRGEWPGLVAALLANMSASPPDHGARQATLQALGYVCEEMALVRDDVLTAEQVNMILTAVVAGLRPEEPSMETRLAAAVALSNAVEFAEHNFNNDAERGYIMQVVCQATVAADSRVRHAAFSCLHEIAANYYGHLPPYMGDIFNITVKAIRTDEEDVALQAVEFWSTLCDYELDLEEEARERAEAGGGGAAGGDANNSGGGAAGAAGGEANHRFIAAACDHLAPVLLEQLTKQDEASLDSLQDEGAWNLAMAAGTCLGLVARVAGDRVVPLVVPFVTQNLTKRDGGADSWRLREAAAFALGSIVEGPHKAAVAPLVREALPYLLQGLKDPVAHVRDSTAWTLGRIFECLHDATDPAELLVLAPAQLPQVVQALAESLATDTEPAVAVRVCDAFGRLAEGYAAMAAPDATSPLSPVLKDSVAALLGAAQRAEAAGAAGGGGGGAGGAGGGGGSNESRLRLAAYEAINDLVRAASADSLETIAQLIPVYLQELAKTLGGGAAAGAAGGAAGGGGGGAAAAEARTRRAEHQGQLCGALQVLFQKLSEEDATKPAVMAYADSIMETLLRVLHSRGGGDADAAAAAAAAADGGAPGPSAAAVHEEAILAVGSFTYACGRQFAKYLPAFMPFLLVGLRNHAEWQVCLSSVGVLGDVARNVEGGGLAPYADEVMRCLVSNLGSNDVHRAVKPQILSAFGDLALVMGGGFDKYLAAVKPVLRAAMGLSVQQARAAQQQQQQQQQQQEGGAGQGGDGLPPPYADEELLQYQDDLRTGIIEAYSGIFQGLGPAADAPMRGEVAAVVEFVSSIGGDARPDPEVASKAVNLLGDLCSVVPGAGEALRQGGQGYQRLVQEVAGDKSAAWAVGVLSAALR
jgi:importin subunit beta-1